MSEPGYHYRFFETKDLHAVATVHVRTWQYAYKGLLPDALLNNMSIEKRATEWRRSMLMDSLKHRMYVADVDGKVAGFCVVGKAQDTDLDDNTGELLAIYVDPDYMGKGIGFSLHQLGINLLKSANYDQSVVWFMTYNEKVRLFYQKRGWVNDNKIKVRDWDGFQLHESRYRMKFA